MVEPTLTDYVDLLFNLFERFWQQHATPARRGHPYGYHHKVFIVFFVIMHQRRIFRFKAQHRWLRQHPERHTILGLDTVPNRTTLSRRYKALYEVVQQFIVFVGVHAEDLDPRFTSQDLDTDKSLFKAHGPVWHQSDRKEGRFQRNYVISTPMAHGAKVATTAGSMATACIWSTIKRVSPR